MAVGNRNHNLPVVLFVPFQGDSVCGSKLQGFKTFLSGSTRFLLVIKEMGWCLLKKHLIRHGFAMPPSPQGEGYFPQFPL
jgi:hypothetical protein